MLRKRPTKGVLIRHHVRIPGLKRCHHVLTLGLLRLLPTQNPFGRNLGESCLDCIAASLEVVVLFLREFAPLDAGLVLLNEKALLPLRAFLVKVERVTLLLRLLHPLRHSLGSAECVCSSLLGLELGLPEPFILFAKGPTFLLPLATRKFLLFLFVAFVALSFIGKVHLHDGSGLDSLRFLGGLGVRGFSLGRFCGLLFCCHGVL
jgi:hypothetical protein